jgi:T5orf172 domain
MSNKSMPGLVKVGFSTKDPDMRAQELNHTGTPHPYVVDYEALVQDPYAVEQEAHLLLRDYREGKEWFRCPAEDAITALRTAVNDSVLHESFRKTDRAAVDAKRAADKLKAEGERLQVERKAAARKKLEERVTSIRNLYDPTLKSLIIERPFWQYWLGGTFLAFIGLALIAPNTKESSGFIISAIVGAIIGVFVQSGSEERQKKTPKYLGVKAEMEEKVRAATEPSIRCSTCSNNVTYDPVEIATAVPGTNWQCPKCNSPVRVPAI